MDYEISVKEWKNIHDLDDPDKATELYKKVPNTAFINDTIWIIKFLHNLEQLLTIAQSFFTLNDIWINNNKATLITNND